MKLSEGFFAMGWLWSAPPPTSARDDRRSALNVLGGEDGVEQTGEAGVEVVLAQRVHDRGALILLADHAGLAQCPEVVGRR